MKTLENIWEVELSFEGDNTVVDKVLVSTDGRDLNAAAEKAVQWFIESCATPEDANGVQAVTVKLTGQTIIL